MVIISCAKQLCHPIKIFNGFVMLLNGAILMEHSCEKFDKNMYVIPQQKLVAVPKEYRHSNYENNCNRLEQTVSVGKMTRQKSWQLKYLS